MKATTGIDNKTGTTHGAAANFDGRGDINTLQETKARARAGQEKTHQGKAESELRAAARRHGLTLKELAGKMGVSPDYLSQIGNGHRLWSPAMREKVIAVLGEVPGQGVVYRQDGVLEGGESTYFRERARAQGLTLRQVAERAGVSYRFMSDVSRGRRNFSPGVQARVEKVLDAPVKVEAAQRPTVDPSVLWERMDAHNWSQNETARRAGISPAMLSQVMNGQRTPSGDVLRRLHEVLFAPSAAEMVAPVELKVLAWKKGGRNGVVVKGAGGPGSGTIRTGGRVPWGAEVEFAYTSGYDRHGRVSVNHIVDERGCAAMLKQVHPDGV